MKITHSRLMILLSAALALLLALTQPVLGLVFAFLTPFWFFVTYVVTGPARSVRRICKALTFPTVLVFSPRPPPVR